MKIQKSVLVELDESDEPVINKLEKIFAMTDLFVTWIRNTEDTDEENALCEAQETLFQTACKLAENHFIMSYTDAEELFCDAGPTNVRPLLIEWFEDNG